METAYLICFLAGGTLLVCQFLMSLVGFGDHGDVAGEGHDIHIGHGLEHGADGDHDSYQSMFLGVLTFRSVVAGLTFFGLAGLAAQKYLEWPRDIAAAGAAGIGTILLVGFLMRSLHRLKAEGTVRIERTVGKNATVYLRIPAQKSGTGKVTVSVQNRTMEYLAITPNQELPTGAQVVVVNVIGPDTIEVVPANETGSKAHV